MSCGVLIKLKGLRIIDHVLVIKNINQSCFPIELNKKDYEVRMAENIS